MQLKESPSSKQSLEINWIVSHCRKKLSVFGTIQHPNWLCIKQQQPYSVTGVVAHNSVIKENHITKSKFLTFRISPKQADPFHYYKDCLLVSKAVQAKPVLVISSKLTLLPFQVGSKKKKEKSCRSSTLTSNCGVGSKTKTKKEGELITQKNNKKFFDIKINLLLTHCNSKN